MKRRLVAVTLSLIMTMATVSEAGAAAFTSPDTAPAVATQTDAEEVNVTEETSETEADAFSDGDDGTAVPSQEQTDDAFTAGTDTAAALPDETPSTADATDAVGAAVVKAEDWVSTENGFKLRKPAKNQDTANTDDQKAATAALPDEEMLSETDGFSGDQTESSETAVAETDTTAVTAEVTAMETPAATDTVSVTNEEFYTVADGIVKISTEYKGETHTGYYLFDEEGILVTGQAEVKEKSSADEEPTSDAAQSAGEDAAGEETEAQANQSYFTTADEAVVYTGCEGEAITPYTSTVGQQEKSCLLYTSNIFIVLILALICSILPSGVMIFVGFALMVAHGYALGIEVAGFMLVLILFMAILFLRFSSDNNLVLVFTPLSFGFSVPTLLPIGSGLLCNAFSALPAGCGVIIYYFIRFIRVQHKLLENPDVAIADKLKLLTDGIVQNWGMWITVIAFIAVILLVNLIRTRSFDYAWRIAIIAGGVVYVLMIIAGGFYFRLDIDVVTLIIYTVISVVIGLLLEFFVFGGDYTRTERLEYEDDEYYYYVKAVPKACVTTSERSIKKINGSSAKDERPAQDNVVSYANPIFHGDEKAVTTDEAAAPVERKKDIDSVDFEKKLEESLKNL